MQHLKMTSIKLASSYFLIKTFSSRLQLLSGGCSCGLLNLVYVILVSISSWGALIHMQCYTYQPVLKCKEVKETVAISYQNRTYSYIYWYEQAGLLTIPHTTLVLYMCIVIVVSTYFLLVLGMYSHHIDRVGPMHK